MKKLPIVIVAALAVGAGAAQAQSSLTAGGAPDPIAKIPILMKTVEEWQALPSFGGSSGSAKFQLVNVVGDPSKPACTSSWKRWRPMSSSRHTITLATAP
jgi:hypothetical protein